MRRRSERNESDATNQALFRVGFDGGRTRLKAGPARMLKTVRRVIAALIGVFVAAVAVFVLVGMIDGADPNFSKGRSSTQSVVAQEVAGALALVALASALVGCINVAQGKHVGRLLIPLLVAVVLVVAWQLAYLVERAS